MLLLIDKLKAEIFQNCEYLTEDEKEQLQHAMVFSESAHFGQKRATGEPYVVHPLEVCLILSEYRADLITLICALLHDVVEDTSVSLLEIKKHFGMQVTFIVDGLTKYEKARYEKEEYAAINMQKLLFTAVQDIRVVIVKLADRLHNMRTLSIKKIEKRIPYANETLLFFSPLAEKVGLFKLQSELEELGFSYLNPHKYFRYKTIINNHIQDNSALFDDLTIGLEEKDTNEEIINIELQKEPIFKSYIKLSEGEDISGLFTIHVITKSTINCYTALGFLHSLFEPLPNQFIDQIATHKIPSNKYLETKIKIKNQAFTVRIYDKYTHYLYGNGILGYLHNTKIRELGELLLGDAIQTVNSMTDSPVAFCELVSSEIFQKEITVFTSEMDSVILPINSNIIDFAYALDFELGNRIDFAKVNGENKSIQTVLQDRDIVEVYTRKDNSVSAKWLTNVKTSKAIKEIMKFVETD